MNKFLLCAALCLFLTAGAGYADAVADGFLSPPKDTQPGCYWYFFKDDVTKDGITKDLEAMKRVGIGRAFIGYINQGANPVGDNHVLTEKWWERLEHTFLEADRLGIDIGLFNCPGWSQSGGPWITPDRSMRNLVDEEVHVTGPAEFNDILPAREGYFETVRVLAFPAPAGESVTMADFGLAVSSPDQDAPNPFTGGTVGFRSTLRYAGDPGNPAGLVKQIRVLDGGGNVVFEDDFSDGLRKWRDTGDSRVEDGVLHPVNADNPPMHNRRPGLPEAFTLETTVKINPGGLLGIAFGIQDAQNCAFWQVSQGLLRTHVKVNGQHAIAEHPVEALVEEKWLDIRIACDGETVRTFVGDALVNEQAARANAVGGTVEALFDGDPGTTFTFPRVRGNDAPFALDFNFDRPFPVQSVIAGPVGTRCGVSGELLASDDGTDWRKVGDIDLFHGHQGAKIGDPMVAAVPATTARHYRFQVTGAPDNRTLASLELSPRAMLNKHVIKQLGDIHHTPHPMYGTYEWDTQAEPGFEGSVLPAAAAIDLTDRLDAEGRLTWSVPAGEWVIARFAMVSTGSKNGPAMPDATGLECDKMSAEHIQYHFDNYIGKVLERIPPENRRRFKYVIQDSYETGPQNWTDGLLDTFEARYGYDPVPWLPVTTGRIVGSAEQSERFLWDLRRLVADLIGSEYVGGLTAAAEANGLKGWLENYGHWGFPGEFLIYGKNSSQVGGEFWLRSSLGTIENRPPASCAHIYGKQEVFAEAFTSGIKYVQTPQSDFKHYGDWAFCQGINHFIFHVYIHQPRSDERPGVDAPFGTNFTRHNTWFNLLPGYVHYTQRVNYMMRRGTNVADVCYFLGEGAPKMDGPNTPALPRGYDFDFVNGDVILNRMTVENGRIAIPGGPSYKVMVLPPVDTMRPEIAAKLKTFVDGGAVVCGPRPVKSPSLANYPACDAALAETVDALWGAGRIKDVEDLAPVLAAAGVTPDFAYTLLDEDLNGKDSALTDLSYAVQPQGNSLRFAHRREGDMDIYFVSNMQTDRGFEARCAFRVGAKQPEIWDPVSGDTWDATAYTLTDTGVELTMPFAPKQSWIFVFRRPVQAGGAGTSNVPVTTQLAALEGPWTVRFDPAWGGPEAASFPELVSWTDRAEEGIKYYSGEAVYETSFDLAAAPKGRAWLDLGQIADLGEVTLNGEAVGIVWVEPWTIEVTGRLKAGKNTLQVKVANTWNNRIFGDQESETRFTKFYTPYRTGRLLPAGLLGPVKVAVE